MSSLPSPSVNPTPQFALQFQNVPLTIDNRGRSPAIIIVPRLVTLGYQLLRLNFSAIDQSTVGQGLGPGCEVVLTLFLQDKAGTQIQEVHQVLPHNGSVALGGVFSAVVDLGVSAPQVSISAQAVNFPKGRSYLATTSTYLL